MTQLTSTGLTVSRLDERFAELVTAFKAIYGADIVLDANSIDGQTTGVYAASINELDQLVGQLYSAFDPGAASGSVLRRLVQLNGIKALDGSYSTTVLTLGGTFGTSVPAGSLFHSTATTATFSTDVAVVIPISGTVNVAATATAIGAQVGPAGTITAIDTPTYGLQTVTNAADAVVGREPETDGELRLRRSKSVAYPSQTVREGIYAGVANLDGVTHTAVYENDQPAVDANGQAANSFYVVVEGGTEQDIVQTIMLKKTGGIPTVGSLSALAIDSMGKSHPIHYDRPTARNIYVTINGTKRPGYPSDGDNQMKDAIVAWALEHYDIGQEVIQSELYEPLAAIPSKSISSLYIGTAPGPVSTANISMLYNQLAKFETVRIVVNMV